MKPGAILSLISFFSVLSILSIGGSNSVVPEMARHAVEVEHWLTAAQFTNIFAISQATPGPSNLIVALIGFKVAGFWGALVAQLAMMLPAASLMLLVSRVWVASSGSPWHLALEHGLAPIAVGLIFASGWHLALVRGTASLLELKPTRRDCGWRRPSRMTRSNTVTECTAGWRTVRKLRTETSS